MLALLVVALALGLNNFGAAIAIGVSGVDRLTGLKAAAVFGRTSSSSPESPRSTSTANAAAPGEQSADLARDHLSFFSRTRTTGPSRTWLGSAVPLSHC